MPQFITQNSLEPKPRVSRQHSLALHPVTACRIQNSKYQAAEATQCNRASCSHQHLNSCAFAFSYMLNSRHSEPFAAAAALSPNSMGHN